MKTCYNSPRKRMHEVCELPSRLMLQPGRLARHLACVVSHPRWPLGEVRKRNHRLPSEPPPKLRDEGRQRQPPKPAPFGDTEGEERSIVRAEDTSHEPADAGTHRLSPRPRQPSSTVPAKGGIGHSYRPDAWRCNSVSSWHGLVPALRTSQGSAQLPA